MNNTPLPPPNQYNPNQPAPRTVPQSELDLQLMMTNPEWGRESVSPELRDKLTKILGITEDAETKQKTLTIEGLWGLLSYYTKDIRLGNISYKNGEMTYCAAYLDFAGDCLREGYVRGFLAAISRVITLLELSQSKDGFLRKRMGTITSEQYQEILEPKKKNFFGGAKNNEGRQYG